MEEVVAEVALWATALRFPLRGAKQSPSPLALVGQVQRRLDNRVLQPFLGHSLRQVVGGVVRAIRTMRDAPEDPEEELRNGMLVAQPAQSAALRPHQG